MTKLSGRSIWEKTRAVRLEMTRVLWGTPVACMGPGGRRGMPPRTSPCPGCPGLLGMGLLMIVGLALASPNQEPPGRHPHPTPGQKFHAPEW
jgi:hypothetical protein